MITKCANELCGEPFLFFRGGKLFIVDVRSNPQPGNPSTADQAPQKLEHFWLCEHCAATMTLVVGQGRGRESTRERLPRQPHGAAPGPFCYSVYEYRGGAISGGAAYDGCKLTADHR